MASLPKFVALKSVYNQKYMQYIIDNIEDGVQMHGLLKFAGDELVSPYTKFQVEPAACGNGLVHLKCCYNNKYCVRWSEVHWWIAAATAEPEEDQTKWACTLFKPLVVDDGAKTIQLVHVQLGHHACLWRAAAPFTNCLFAGYPDNDRDKCDVYTVIDWESLFVLPKSVAFKSNNIGKYLSGHNSDGEPYLLFVSAEFDDANAANEVFVNPDGSIRIKSSYFNKFWKRNPDKYDEQWIWANGDDSSSQDPDCMFWPLKNGEKGGITLRNLGNNKYCKRYSGIYIDQGFSANGLTLDDSETNLIVSELVTLRKIYNVKYQLLDARYYDEKVVTLATQTINNATLETSIQTIELVYQNTQTSTWSSTLATKVFSTVALQADVEVIVAAGSTGNSTAFADQYEWGEIKDFSSKASTTYNATVPRKTKMTVNLVATMGSYDIPFSYTQCDTPTTGKQIVSEMKDGIYTRVNIFDLKFQTTQEPAA